MNIHTHTYTHTRQRAGMKGHEDAVLFQCIFVLHYFFCRTCIIIHTHTHTRQLAGLKGHEDAVLFPCGFSANVAVAAVLAADDDVICF
jgi:hypothetical protein